jgi:hypothetical protein
VIDMYAGPNEHELGLFPTRVVALPGGTTAFTFSSRRFAPAAADILADLDRLVAASLSPRRAAALEGGLRRIMELETSTDAV